MSDSAEFIRDIYRRGQAESRPIISLEFFPAKTPEGEEALLQKTIPALLDLRPDYCSVTYGAGGSTRRKTLDIVHRIQTQHHLTSVAHLTCVNATQSETKAILEEARQLGIKNILALRGDPPNGTGAFQAVKDGFEYSYQLVRFIRELGDFSIGVAGFPEGHVACKEGKVVDWRRLKHKIDCGADFVLTQLFFDNRDYFEFRDFLVKAGVTIPVCPGIIPILSAGQIKRFTALCGAALPEPLLGRLAELEGDDAAAAEFGIEYASAQCEELLREGAPGLHFYTLNKSRSTTAILRQIGLANPVSRPSE